MFGKCTGVLTVALWLGIAGSTPRAAVAPAARYSKGVVAADHPLASEAGVKILREGGNAVDAACATAFALGVVNPAGSGIGGGGFMLFKRAGADPVILDFREVAPAGAHRKMFSADGVSADASRTGGLAVAVPGEVAGCAAAVKQFGKLGLRRVMKPAILLASKGFPTGAHLANAVAWKKKELSANPALSRMFLPNGKPLVAGQWTSRPHLARALREIARQGPSAFYSGWIARDIVETVKAGGGVLSMEDLARYAVKTRRPLRSRYRGHDVYTMPPPSSGGIAIIQTLNMLRDTDLAALGHNSSRHLHQLTEALKHAFADRARHVGDPDFVKVPVARLTSLKYADKLRRRIRGKVLKLKQYGSPSPARSPSAGSAGTSHISVVDRHGSAVALTTTVNTSFGSKLATSKSGIILNNEMDDFAARPGKPNAFGLIQGEQNAAAPGKRPLSSMSPTIVTRGKKVVLVAGASGGPSIITGTLQAISNVIDFGMEPADAVSRSRVHHQWLPEVLMVERDLPADVLKSLRRRGHAIKVWPHPYTAVQVVQVKAGGVFGASDPRKMGRPAGY